MSLSLLQDLVNERLLTPEQAEQVVAEQRKTKQSISMLPALRRLALLGEDELLSFLSRRYRMPIFDRRELEVSRDLIKLVSGKLVRRHRVLPIRRSGNTLTLALSDPTLLGHRHVRAATGLRVFPFLASEAAIEAAILRYYPEPAGMPASPSPIARSPLTSTTDWRLGLLAFVYILVGLFLPIPGPGITLISFVGGFILFVERELPLGVLPLLLVGAIFIPFMIGDQPYLSRPIEKLRVLAPLVPGVAPDRVALALGLGLMAASIVGGVSVFKRVRGARGFLLGLGVVYLVTYPLFPFSTVLGAYTIWAVMRKERPSDLFSQQVQNRRASWVVAAVFVLFVAFVGASLIRYGSIILALVLGPFHVSGPRLQPSVAIGIGALLGAGLAWLAYRYGDRAILASSFARPVRDDDPNAQLLGNVVVEMAIAAGLPTPRVYVVDDPDPNAFAIGRDPAHAVIVVTRGLLTTLARDELQGVVAHELAHIRNYDTRKMTLVTALLGGLLLLTDWAPHVPSGTDRIDMRAAGRVAGLVALSGWVVAVIVAPTIGQLLAMAVSRRREYLADAAAAELTRNPAALAGALRKLAASPGPTRQIPRGTAHLCIVDPVGDSANDRDGALADLLASHPPLGERVPARGDGLSA